MTPVRRIYYCMPCRYRRCSKNLLFFQNITQHLLHHVVTGIRNFGPLYSTWMYGFERLNGWCSDRAINRRHPESTIIETYLVC